MGIKKNRKIAIANLGGSVKRRKRRNNLYFYHSTIITIKENEKELKESWKAYKFIQCEIT